MSLQGLRNVINQLWQAHRPDVDKSRAERLREGFQALAVDAGAAAGRCRGVMSFAVLIDLRRRRVSEQVPASSIATARKAQMHPPLQAAPRLVMSSKQIVTQAAAAFTQCPARRRRLVHAHQAPA